MKLHFANTASAHEGPPIGILHYVLLHHTLRHRLTLKLSKGWPSRIGQGLAEAARPPILPTQQCFGIGLVAALRAWQGR